MDPKRQDGWLLSPSKVGENGSLKPDNNPTQPGRMYSLILKANLKGQMESKLLET